MFNTKATKAADAAASRLSTFKVVASVTFVALAGISKLPPTMGTVSVSLVLAVILAIALLPVVREYLEDMLK